MTAGLVEVDSRVRFRHPLVRSAVYRDASPGDRRHHQHPRIDDGDVQLEIRARDRPADVPVDAGPLVVAAVQEVLVGATMGFLTFLVAFAVICSGVSSTRRSRTPGTHGRGSRPPYVQGAAASTRLEAGPRTSTRHASRAAPVKADSWSLKPSGPVLLRNASPS